MSDLQKRLAALRAALSENQAARQALTVQAPPSKDLEKERQAAMQRMVSEQALERQAAALASEIGEVEAQIGAQEAQQANARRIVLQAEIEGKAESLSADLALLSAKAAEIDALAVELTNYTGPHGNRQFAALSAQLAEIAQVISPATQRRRQAKSAENHRRFEETLRKQSADRRRKADAAERLRKSVEGNDRGAWA